NVAYTWASNTSLGDNDLQLNAVPQDNNNLRADHGPAPFALRHVFTTGYLYELPFAHLLGINGRAGKMALAGWQLSGVFTASSGAPVNITNSRSSYSNSRPDRVPGVPAKFENYRSTLLYLNPAAFVAVPLATTSGASIRPGNVG